MWRTWLALALVWCARGEESLGSTEGDALGVLTTPPPRVPPRTLDRQAAELAWRAWLQSAESKDPSAPPRRITTKSLFITPLVCPKGQRLDRDGCVQVVTVNKEEHERYLLEQLNALFTSAPGEEYDYGDEEPGPFQLSIPLALEAAPLQAQVSEPQQYHMKVDKKEDTKFDPVDASIEAELELLKLQTTQTANDTVLPEKPDPAVHNVLNNFISTDKPKRDSPDSNKTEIDPKNNTREGQKEVVFGHISVDPVLSYTDYNNQDATETATNLTKGTESKTSTTHQAIIMTVNDTAIANNETSTKAPDTDVTNPNDNVKNKTTDETKLKPENDYSDIGEAIKLISRYAEVTTDDSFSRNQKKNGNDNKEDTFLGTRTKLQHRRNRPKPPESFNYQQYVPNTPSYEQRVPGHIYPKHDFYRYPWASQSVSPPPNYPFRHLQDYWAGRNHVDGLYNLHGNPRRHHHSYPHFRPHEYAEFAPGLANYRPPGYPGHLPHRVVQRRANMPRLRTNNRDLYSLLGLRHWFSSESAAKR